MRHFIARSLVFFILFGNFSWAADLDEAGIGDGHAVVVAAAAVMDSVADPGCLHQGADKGFCDHCCHGSAHYTGFPAVILHPFATCGACMPIAWVQDASSRDIEPPLPPPDN